MYSQYPKNIQIFKEYFQCPVWYYILPVTSLKFYESLKFLQICLAFETFVVNIKLNVKKKRFFSVIFRSSIDQNSFINIMMNLVSLDDFEVIQDK